MTTNKQALGRTVVTEHFVVLHVPKTGGTFIREMLWAELPRERFVPAPSVHHLAWRELPAEARARPALAYVRNPWDWYVSRYHYARQRHPDRRPPTLIARTFEEEVRAALSRPRTDLFTRRFDRIVRGAAEAGKLTVGRYERLVDDLLDFLDGTGAPFDAGLGDRLRAAPRVRASEHDDYRSYYSPELRDLVGERCALVARFGYEF
ncbi:MAG TPA: hypothetical protein VF587_08960 [Solirubrobacteraceae bacterium]